ncbi:MAG: class 1 fructose-bisphosphatase [Calditrichaeota bacterium]|nr:class 1 fructose-bisphosphatase [Candidatus Cloacimonadota bacterium]MCB1046299.1 class 1 fructose-bisphosphatase [Calditrichota bacterium]MCB9475222.1 class 1 fructose-bisphosphatase [Candidatus Delongbacteria bacterium]
MDGMVTIERHIIEQEREKGGASGMLSELLYDIALACKIIQREVTRAGLIELLGKTGDINIQGETVAKLDEYANDVLVRTLSHGQRVCLIGSEEVDDMIIPKESATVGKYVVLFDPLDGSSNIDANVSIGTIFSIFQRRSPLGSQPDRGDLLQPGSQLVAAGYVVYGSSTMLVYTTRNGSVDGFTYDPSVGEFLRSHRRIRTPERGKIYSVNEGYTAWWEQGIRDFVADLKVVDKERGRPYTSRYIGSLVADFHRNLLYGGVFLYPRTWVDGKKGKGKLRLLYEAMPLAMVAVNAGGAAHSDDGPILEIQPTELHQRTPLFIGSKLDVQDVLASMDPTLVG